MIYAGLKDEQKTNHLVAFLKQFDADGKKKQSLWGPALPAAIAYGTYRELA